MYDSHCHLHETDVMPHCDAIIARAKASGVTGFMLAGVSPEGWNAQLDIQERHPECAVSFGIHPQLIADASEQQLQDMLNDLARRLNSSAPPAAVGEIGLDRATPERKRRSEVGEWLFREQLALARELDLPIILHVLSAHGRAIELLRQDGLPRAGGVMHSYSGAPDLVPVYEALNLHISFTGIICQPRAKKPRAAAQRVSPTRLLAETDAPFQTPAPHQPGANEPAFLTTVVAELARLRATSIEATAAVTAQNARRLFRIT